MRLSLTVLLFVFALPGGWAQLQLGRQVVAPAAVNGNSANLRMSSTVGEPAYRLQEGEELKIKAGFEQADGDPIIPLVVELDVNYQDCWNGSNATIIVNASGCGSVINVTVTQTNSDAPLNSNELSDGQYNVTVETDEGCTDTQLFEVPLPNIRPCDIEVYNLVTPNDDGQNDVFFIGNITMMQYAMNSVRIFNRWGNQVWSGSNYDNVNVVFTGRDEQDRKLPEGTYFYEIQLPQQSFTGYLTLLQ